MTTQLYAKIKKSSKYFYQNEIAKESGYGCPFPVSVGADGPNGTGYVIKGGPGGQYQAKDVNLFAIVENNAGKQIAIKLS